MQLMLDGKEFGKVPVLALEKVDGAGIFGRAMDSVKLWFEKG